MLPEILLSGIIIGFVVSALVFLLVGQDVGQNVILVFCLLRAECLHTTKPLQHFRSFIF